MLNDSNVALEVNSLKTKIAYDMPDNPVLFGWAAYAQFDEDGIVRECLRRISDCIELSRTFLEIGGGYGLNSKTHCLFLEGYRGVWGGGNKAENHALNDSLGGMLFSRLWIMDYSARLAGTERFAQRVKQFLGVDSIDFFSLDVDGNDWHLAPFFINILKPKLVCVEYNAKFRLPISLAMSYNENHSWEGDDYFGASLQAWIDQFDKAGYLLVCCNLSGFNAFFVRNDLLDSFTIYSPDFLYQPPRYYLIDASKGHKPSLHWVKQALSGDEMQRARFVSATLGDEPIQFAVHAGVDQYISGDIEQNGVWEPFESKVFARLCQPGDTVLDLGANIGWYSMLAAKIVGDTGCVFAFEPDADNIRLLEMNASVLDSFGVVYITQSAVGETVGEVLFHKSDTNLGDHRLFSDGSSRETHAVSVTTLDVFFSDEQRNLPDIVKSDTQGSEAKIFQGAKKLFSNGWRPVMILEFWPFGLVNSGNNPQSFWNELQDLGYKTFVVSEGNPRLTPVSADYLSHRLDSDISPESGGFINLLCIPNESARIELISDLIS
jgi:FkbM family methyltransferase